MNYQLPNLPQMPRRRLTPPGGAVQPRIGPGGGGQPGGGGGRRQWPPQRPNPAQFHDPNQPSPITPPAPQGGGAQTPPYTGGLPLDPFFEAGRRSLQDQLAANLALLGPQREALAGQQQLGMARLGTNESNDRRALLDSLGGRGLIGSGIETTDLGMQGTDYLRQRQDLANSIASQYSGLAGQEGGYQNDYQSGLQQLLLDLANRSAASQYTPTPIAPTPTPVAPPPTGGRGGGGGGRRRRR